MSRTVFEGDRFKVSHTIETDGRHATRVEEYYGEYFTITALIHGTGKCFVEGNCYNLNPGDIIILRAYDTAAHQYGPEAKESLNILAREAEIFQHIAEAMEKYKGTHRTLLAYAPDHGQHPLMDGGGQHGSKMIEDMNIVHFFGTK